MIRATDIQKSYGKRAVLKGISFEAKPGECVAIVGRNGCGKTTLLRILAGAMKPDAGELSAFGKHLFQNPALFQKYMGYVPQENPLLETLTVRDNMKLWGVYTSPAFEMLNEKFSLSEMEKLPVRKLSGGMKKRLSIVCALAKVPPIMLMDEPEAALDLEYKSEIRQWVQTFKESGGIVLLTTHDEQVMLSCDRCLVMRDGKVTELSGDEINLSNIKDKM